MTNADRIMAALKAAPGSSDGELRTRTGIEPHQQVNQICRRLASEGRLRRERRPDGTLGNYASGEATYVATAGSSTRNTMPTDAAIAPSASSTLAVLPCSAAKRSGGVLTYAGPSIVDLLSESTARALIEFRARLGVAARLDERRWLPAQDRYEGTLYRSTARLGTADVPVAILSGGYGLLLATEPIGWYDHRFSIGDWPRGLLEACLDEVTAALGVTSAISFCGRSTGYAELMRRFGRSAQMDVVSVSADLAGRGGAMVLAPRAAGEAFDAYLGGKLKEGWRSSDGVDVRIERIERVR